jgi:hypothetical protein
MNAVITVGDRHGGREYSAGTRRLAAGRAITLRDKLACPWKQLLTAGHKSALPLIFDP